MLNSAVAMIPPATSPLVDSLVQAGDTSTVTGWGNTTEGGNLSSVLMEVSLPIVSNTSCNQAYGFITNNMLLRGLGPRRQGLVPGRQRRPVDRARWGWILAAGGHCQLRRGCAAARLPRHLYPGLPLSELDRSICAAIGPPTATPTASPPPPSPTATPTPSPTPTQTPTPTITPTPQLRNGDFEQGPGVAWSEQSSNDFALVVPDNELTRITPHGGTYAAWLGGGTSETSVLSQTMSIRDAHVFTTLRFFYWIGSEETTCGNDTTTVGFGGNELMATDLCTETDTGSWQEKIVDMTLYNGQTHDLVFTTATDQENTSDFYLDDIAITQVPNLSEKVYLPTIQRSK